MSTNIGVAFSCKPTIKFGHGNAADMHLAGKSGLFFKGLQGTLAAPSTPRVGNEVSQKWPTWTHEVPYTIHTSAWLSQKWILTYNPECWEQNVAVIHVNLMNSMGIICDHYITVNILSMSTGSIAFTKDISLCPSCVPVGWFVGSGMGSCWS